MVSKVFLAAVLAACLAVTIDAHGGHLHAYPSTPSGSNYARNRVATCSKWVPATAKTSGRRLLATPSAKPTIKGSVTIWTYLYKNCSNALTSGAEININVTTGGKPANKYTLSGWGQEGACNVGGGVSREYYLNETARGTVDTAHARLWFDMAQTSNTGRLWGNGANDGVVKTLGKGALKSFLLVDGKNSPLYCCDLVLTGKAETNWGKIKGGQACTEDGVPLKSLTINSMGATQGKHSSSGGAAASMAGMAGMDHSAHGR